MSTSNNKSIKSTLNDKMIKKGLGDYVGTENMILGGTISFTKDGIIEEGNTKDVAFDDLTFVKIKDDSYDKDIQDILNDE